MDRKPQAYGGQLQRYGSIALLLVVILTPFVGSLFGFKGIWKIDEKRSLAEFPSIQLTLKGMEKFPEGFENYYNDQFFLRPELIRLNSLFFVSVLGMAPPPVGDIEELRSATVMGRGFAWPRVVIGKEGWMFTSANKAIDVHRGKYMFGEDMLLAWLLGLGERHQWCALRGIKYYFVMAPNKHSIYSEKLPSTVHYLSDTSRANLVEGKIRNHSNINYINLTPVLQEAKKQQQVYFKYDTHWNELGAFHGAQAIIEEIRKEFPAIEPLRLEGYSVAVEKSQVPSDLADLLGLGDVYADDRFVLTPKNPPQAVAAEATIKKQLPPGFRPATFRTARKDLPRAIVFHDSFTTALKPYLAESFHEVLFLWSLEFDPEVIEEFKPDVVLTISAERHAMLGVPRNPEGVAGILKSAPPTRSK